MATIKSINMTNQGYDVVVHVPFDKFQLLDLPNSCYTCPLHNCDFDCGKQPDNVNVWSRPITCKATKIELLPETLTIDKILDTYRQRFLYADDKVWFLELARLSKVVNSCSLHKIAEYVQDNYL